MLYEPLYPPSGAPLRGFRCLACNRVTRTERGMRSHCWLVHQLKSQMEFNYEQTDGPVPSIEAKIRAAARESRDPSDTPDDTLS